MDLVSPLSSGQPMVLSTPTKSEASETDRTETENSVYVPPEINENEINNLVKSEPVYRIDNFSAYYYGKAQAENTDLIFRKGWVAIYDKKTNTELIKLYSNELAFDLHGGKVLANILNIPYGEQSLIQYQDYNFDGIKDLAIMDGQNSCYHGPSFKIYLANNRSFHLNEDFTKLAQGGCGMFNLDPAKKMIFTMFKSGCCWHQYSNYIVENNVPKVVYIETVDASQDESGKVSIVTTTERLVGGKWEKKTVTD